MNTFFVDTVLDPALAIFGVLVPLAVAYIIIALQMRFQKTESQRTSGHESRSQK
jgi:hypothetical protein